MKKIFSTIIFALIFQLNACKNEDAVPVEDNTLYFPPIGSSAWETSTPESLGWNTAQVPALLDFLEEKNTRAFLVLKNGKIVIEHYFANDLLGNGFTTASNWYWASAGKTLTATLVGIAQKENYLSIQDKTSSYLGAGWTSMTTTQENQITILNQLTMTSGLDDGGDVYCTLPSCLTFKASPNTRWSYHNAPYTLLDKVIEDAVSQPFDNYFNAKIKNKIGMDGFWAYSGYNHVYYSTARSMARFGLLMLNKGKWSDTFILDDANYYQAMVNTSQNINLSYGYLWWLNGKSSFMAPGLQTVFNTSISPNAPAEMFSAIGKNGQLINIIPSKNIVVIRMGDNPDASEVPITFQNDLWAKLKLVIVN